MKCLLCGGEMTADATTHVAELPSSIVIVKQAPCLKCAQCGETVYTAEVVRILEQITDNAQNMLTEIAVVHYPNRVA